MIKHRIIALTGILILTAVSITGCKGIKKEKGSSSVVESVEEKATETASKEEPEVGMRNPWVEITEEEKTDESFNVMDYLTGNDTSSDKNPSIKGTWETGSIGYEADDGTVQPLYYVQFTDSEINYGHMKEGKFVSEYSDKICLMEETGDSRYRVQAEASNGGKYTYQTCETDKDTLEYYDAWDEKEFPEKYSGGASLTRSSNQ